jgi:hypothetical protein
MNPAHTRLHQAHPSKTKQAKPYFEPRYVCILGGYQARKFEGRDLSRYRCGADQGHHAHYTRSRVLHLIAEGQLEWVGRFGKIATFVQGKTWKKVPSDAVHTMQLVPGGAVLTNSGGRSADRRAAPRSEVRIIKP